MCTVRSQVEAAAKSGANVLIIGRPGSGRTHIAKSIHYSGTGDENSVLNPLEGTLLNVESLRRTLDHLDQEGETRHGHSLLVCDVDALNTELQTLLYEAVSRRKGRIRLLATVNPLAPIATDADGGAAPIQPSSIVLQQQLQALLSTITIFVPRLVDRLDDLPILAQYFLEMANKGQPKQIGAIRSAALDRLALYGWPGELDELRQVMAEAHRACAAAEIDVSDLPPVIHHAVQAASRATRPRETIVLDELLARVELELIERALREASGNKAEAARLLGTTRAKLYRRLMQLGLEEAG
jgi:DNA-binding NtrC family response regulator